MPEESWFEVASDKLKTRISIFLKRNTKKFVFTAIVLLLLLLLFRAQIQPLVLILREYSFVCIAVIIYSAFLMITRWVKIRSIILVPFTLVLIIGLTLYVLTGAQQFIASYLRHQSLSIVELEKLPLTTSERVQPLDSIYVQASEKINETESVSIPDLILEDGQQKWALEIFPTYLGQKLIRGRIEELFVISATSASPDFSQREEVRFSTGSTYYSQKNVKTNAIKSLTPLQYFSCFPTNVKVVPDEKGEWVQLVSLARFKGLFFPHIEFAGVHIIRQTAKESNPWVEYFKRLTLGVGEFISVEKTSGYPFLKGQNLIPYIASQRIAETFKFQKGFLSPVRTYHEGDIRIPQMEGNHNEMPYVLLFQGVNSKVGLFHYFGLEPFDENKHGLSLSLFIPSDGMDKNIYIYDHSRKKESLTGLQRLLQKSWKVKKIMTGRRINQWKTVHI